MKTYVQKIEYIQNYIEKVSGNLSPNNPIDLELYKRNVKNKTTDPIINKIYNYIKIMYYRNVCKT